MPTSSKRVPYSKWVKMTPAAKAKKRAALLNNSRSVSGSGAYKVRKRRIKGRGDYTYEKPGPWGTNGRWIGKAIGSTWGKSAGKLGESVGGLAHYIGKIFGSGDYVASPAVQENTILSPQIPSFSANATTVRVRHREFLGDILSSATANTFDIQAFPINPGLAQTFPWLSQVCGATFQQYRLNGCVFEFRSMSSDALNSTNTALGQVIMATDYDSADTPFSSKQQMENTEFGVSCKPSCNMIHAIECAKKLTSVSEQYIRAYGNPSNTDIRLYDLGRFYIATNGCQGTNVNLGELWVSYDVTFIKTIEQPPLYLAPMAGYNLVSPDVSHPLGISQSSLYEPANPGGGSFPDQIGLTFVGNSIQLPSSLEVGSVYNLFYELVGNSTASVAAPVVTFTHGLSSVGNTIAYPASGTATSAVLYYLTVFVYSGGGTEAAPPTIDFTPGVVPTGSTGGLNIYQISPAMASNNVF